MDDGRIVVSGLTKRYKALTAVNDGPFPSSRAGSPASSAPTGRQDEHAAHAVEPGYGTQLARWGVVRAILLNLAAYAIWAVFGVGFGALVRS
jgi:hypothetical protein